jgi:folate-binding protein YgfZ
MTDSYLLDHFGFLKISGVDAVNFMQGYTTCDLAALTDETAQMGAICNIQGRMLVSFLVINQGQDLIMRMNRALIPATISFLSKYIVFSKATLEDISETLVCIGSPLQENATGVVRQDNHFLINLGSRQEKWTQVTQSDNASTKVEPWSELELAAGIVWVTESTTEQFLPQMFNYHNQEAIDFKKGCYLGQEIVARMQYRGELKRRLHRIDQSGQLKVGDELSGGHVVATSPTSALAVLKNATDESIEIALPNGKQTNAIPV